MELFSLIKEYSRLMHEGTQLNKKQAILDKQIKNGIQHHFSTEKIKELEKQKAANLALIKVHAEKLEQTKSACKGELTNVGIKAMDAVQEMARQGIFIHTMLTGSPDSMRVMNEFLQARELSENFLAEEQKNKHVNGLRQQLVGKKPVKKANSGPIEKDSRRQMLDDKTLLEIKRREEERRLREQQKNMGRKR